MNQLINDKAVYRTAPATPGLLIISLLELHQVPSNGQGSVCEVGGLGSLVAVVGLGHRDRNMASAMSWMMVR